MGVYSPNPLLASVDPALGLKKWLHTKGGGGFLRPLRCIRRWAAGLLASGTPLLTTNIRESLL